MIRYDPEVGIEPRLVMCFPLNGHVNTGEQIFLLEYNEREADIPHPYLRVGTHGDKWCHDTLADAIRIALNNSGWGTFQIKDVTNDS